MRSRAFLGELFLPTAAALLILAGCDKDKPVVDGPITKPTDTASTTAPSTASAPSGTTVASNVLATATPSTTTTASVAVAGDAGKAASKDAKDAGGASTTTALKAASKHVNGKNFALDLASPGCKAAEECAMTIKLSAVGDYHVNKEYPYKFVAAPAPGVAFLGKADANTFGRASGDFVEQGEKIGMLTVRFKPASAGEAKVSGTYKLSVCSADQCQIEQETVELAVPVM